MKQSYVFSWIEENKKKGMIEMKKLLTFILSAVLIFTMTSCTSNNSNEEQDIQQNNTSVETVLEETNEITEEGDLDTAQQGNHTLVAYFSWSGNTEQMAKMIQENTDADLFEISPVTAYSNDYNALLDQAQQEQSDNARPEISAEVENWDDYDVVFVGYPNWWNDAPMIIYTFLESYDWSGKTLIPFCTSGGSGFGQSLDSIEESSAGAVMGEGLHVLGDDIEGAQEEVTEWISALGLDQ